MARTKYNIGNKVCQIVTHDNGFTVRTGKVFAINITEEGTIYTIDFACGVFPVIDRAKEKELLDIGSLRLAVSCLLDKTTKGIN